MDPLLGDQHRTFHHRGPFRRRLLHEAYGGQRQGGISTPNEHPFILLFTGDTDEQYGYRDVWLDDGTFRYTGEGQVRDMSFVRGNRAIHDHAIEGKDLYLFEKTSKGHVQLVGQMVCAGYEWVPGVAHVYGEPRTIIVFYLQPIDTLDADHSPGTGTAIIEEASKAASTVRSMPMEQLRSAAVDATAPNAPSMEARRNVYRRSAAVRVYVLRRSAGACEGCESPAPFATPQGRPYLEPHHIRRLSDGGPDHPDHVIALCPNCHRRVHHGADGAAFNKELQQKMTLLGKV